MLACEIAALPQAAATDALDELLDARLVRATTVPGRFAFRHPLVRRAVYESAKGGWKLGAHARAAALLAARGASSQQRAHHVEQSASAGDAAAIEQLLEAGDDAAPRAPAAAARWYGAALRLLPETDDALRLRALVSLAKAHGAMGELDPAAATLREAIELVPPGDVRLRVRLTAVCAAAEHFLGSHEQATLRLNAALDSLPDETSPEGVTVLLALAAGGILNYDAGGMIWSRRALDAARRLDDPVLIGAAASAVAHASANHGTVEQIQAGADEASRCFDSVPRDALAAHLDAVNRLAWGEFLVDRYDDAIRHAKMGVALARATGQDAFVPMIAGAHAVSAMRRGDLAVAAALQEDAVETAQVSANDYVTSWVFTVSGHVYSAMGRMQEARAAAERPSATPPCAATPASRRSPGSGWPRRAARWATAAPPPPTSSRRAGGWEFPRLPPVWVVYYAETMARVEVAAGRLEEAEAFVRRAETTARKLGLPLSLAVAGRGRAVMLLAAGRDDEARDMALASAAAAEREGAPIEAARGSLVAGRASRRPHAGRAAAPRRRARLRPLRGASATGPRRGGSSGAWARGPSRAGPGERPRPGRLAVTARARGRRARDRAHDQPRGGRRAVPQREDRRVAPAEHLRQARRLLAGRRRPRRRARRRAAQRVPSPGRLVACPSTARAPPLAQFSAPTSWMKTWTCSGRTSYASTNAWVIPATRARFLSRSRGDCWTVTIGIRRVSPTTVRTDETHPPRAGRNRVFHRVLGRARRRRAARVQAGARSVPRHEVRRRRPHAHQGLGRICADRPARGPQGAPEGAEDAGDRPVPAASRGTAGSSPGTSGPTATATSPARTAARSAGASSPTPTPRAAGSPYAGSGRTYGSPGDPMVGERPGLQAVGTIRRSRPPIASGPPLIGVVTHELRGAPEPAWAPAPGRRERDLAPHRLSLRLTYTQAIQEAGGIAVVVPTHGFVDDTEAIADRLDGLLFSGGPDIDPGVYGHAPHPQLGPDVDRDGDEYELALLTAAAERDVPVLGICRGMQALNVSRGGTLHQHLPDRTRSSTTRATRPSSPRTRSPSPADRCCGG